ncbi:MAG: hypothetical protein GY786_02825 [Proteobacteria bacterium]|nr:hypothetical protein [Pseudomonadota bacterium]
MKIEPMAIMGLNPCKVVLSLALTGKQYFDLAATCINPFINVKHFI